MDRKPHRGKKMSVTNLTRNLLGCKSIVDLNGGLGTGMSRYPETHTRRPRGSFRARSRTLIERHEQSLTHMDTEMHGATILDTPDLRRTIRASITRKLLRSDSMIIDDVRAELEQGRWTIQHQPAEGLCSVKLILP